MVNLNLGDNNMHQGQPIGLNFIEFGLMFPSLGSNVDKIMAIPEQWQGRCRHQLQYQFYAKKTMPVVLEQKLELQSH